MKTKTTTVWLVLIIAAVGTGAIANYVRGLPRLAQSAPLVQPLAPAAEHPAPSEPKPRESILLFAPQMGSDGIAFTKSSVDVPDGADEKIFAVNQFLSASHVVPSGATLLGVDLKGGVAILGFSPAFRQTYGTFDEKTLLDGLAATLGQFDDVNAYTLEIDGTPIDTLGSVDLKDPVPVTRPADVPVSKPSFGENSSPPVNSSSPTHP